MLASGEFNSDEPRPSADFRAEVVCLRAMGAGHAITIIQPLWRAAAAAAAVDAAGPIPPILPRISAHRPSAHRPHHLISSRISAHSLTPSPCLQQFHSASIAH